MTAPVPRIRPLPSPVVDATWERIRGAVVDLVLERGYPQVGVAAICERAGVSRKQFDRRFHDAQDCCDRVYEANIADFDAVVMDAYSDEASWRDGLRAAAYAAAGYLAEHPRETRYGEIQMREGGPMAQAARDRYLQRIVELVDAGRQELDDPDSMGRGVAESVIGSIYVFLLKELGESHATRLAFKRVPDLMYLAVRPYLGHEVALRELAIPPPEPAGEAR